MIVTKDEYQIAQMVGEDKVTIYRKKKVFKVLPAAKELTYKELERILDGYRID